MNTGTICALILNVVTSHDRRAAKRAGYNPNALALYCQGVANVREGLGNGLPLRAALKEGFCGSLLRKIAKKLTAKGAEIAPPYDNWE